MITEVVVIQTTESDMDRLGSANILDNLGIMLFFFILLILMVIILAILAVSFRKNKKVLSVINRVKGKLFWNSFIRFILQSTLKMQLSAGAALVLTLTGSQLDVTKQAKEEE